jgi:hypothetical protein
MKGHEVFLHKNPATRKTKQRYSSTAGFEGQRKLYKERLDN